MKRILWSPVLLYMLIACSPAKQDTQESEGEQQREYMMDDDIMDKEEVEKDDSLKNRDMLSGIYAEKYK